MAKKVLVAAVLLIAVVGGLVGVKAAQFKAMFAQQAHAAAPPESVSTGPVEKRTVKPTLSAVGSVTAVQGVMLNAEVAGPIKRIAFESGTPVKAGDVLVELDTSVEKAQLEAALASQALARINLDSGRSLVDSGAIAKNQFITLDATAKQAQAEVGRLQALIAKKTIRAPFAGRTGLRTVNLGQFVNSGTPVVSLQSLDPVYVDFSLPQQRLAQLTVGSGVRVTTDVFPGESFGGTLSAIHPEVDAQTRSIRLRATLKNPDDRLRPGMFAKAEVELPNIDNVLLVPATAITYAPYGDSVFVVEAAKDRTSPATVQQKFVRVGDARGDYVVISEGLKAGETVVTSGAFKLKNGMSVVVNNDVRPEPSDTPKPTDT